MSTELNLAIDWLKDIFFFTSFNGSMLIVALIISMATLIILSRRPNDWKILAFPVTLGWRITGFTAMPLIIVIITGIMFVIEALSQAQLGSTISAGIKNLEQPFLKGKEATRNMFTKKGRKEFKDYKEMERGKKAWKETDKILYHKEMDAETRKMREQIEDFEMRRELDERKRMIDRGLLRQNFESDTSYQVGVKGRSTGNTSNLKDVFYGKEYQNKAKEQIDARRKAVQMADGLRAEKERQWALGKSHLKEWNLTKIKKKEYDEDA